MLKLVSVLTISIVILFFLQSCTYIGNRSISLTIAAMDSQGKPEKILINSDNNFLTPFYPSYDKFVHAKLNLKLPLVSFNGNNTSLKITDPSTINLFIDSKPFDFEHRFYLNNGSIYLTGTVPATDNLYYMDYVGRGRLQDGLLKVSITEGSYTIYFPQYSKTFLIKSGKIYDLHSQDWSIKLYMDDGGDSSSPNLESFLKNDIQEIKHNYFYPDKSSILAYADFSGPSHYTYKFLRNEFFEVNSQLTDNSYDWHNLKTFLSIPSTSTYKALFLWNHGDSWVYHDNSKALFVDNNDKVMNLTGLSSALDESHFDVLAFDMCLMGSVEVLYQVKNYANYIVFSEHLVPSSGFDYQNLLCGDYNPKDFALYICKRYYDFYNGNYSLTAVDANYADDFFSSLSILSDSLTSLASSDNNFVVYIKDLTKVAEDPRNIDVEYSYNLNYGYQIDLLFLLNKILLYPELSEEIKDKINNLKNSLYKMAISDTKDIGIAFISPNGYFDFSNYSHNLFSNQNHWVRFLRLLSERIKDDGS